MLILLFLLFVGASCLAEVSTDYYCYSDGHLKKHSACRFFAIVLDAGSTGTRLHLYRFIHATEENRLPFRTEEELIWEAKPGLSGHFGRPSEAASSVEKLLINVHEHVPQSLRNRTPIVLKATAGLRLLPGDSAQEIINEVNGVVRASGFVCMDKDSVGILDSDHEGVFSWFTLNLLLHNFYSERGDDVRPTPSSTVPVFDLGGGSMQATFWPTDKEIFKNHPDDRYDINFFEIHMHLFTHSFLGTGLQSGRLNTLRLAGDEKEEKFASPCFPADFSLPEWQHSQKSWHIIGSSSYSTEDCLDSIRKYIRGTNIMELSQLSKDSVPIHLISYFHDRGLFAGVPTQGTVLDFKRAALEACVRSTASFSSQPHWYPWQCFDLTYIYSLLTDGFAFEDNHPIRLVKKVQGMEVSWALGLAYSLVDEFHSKIALEDIDDDLADDTKKGVAAENGVVNATGVLIIDSFLTIVSQRTNDLLNYFNLLS